MKTKPGRAQMVVFAWLALGCLTACSPGLNWREVHLGELSAMLPCKPDQAERPVPLGERTLTMEMLGCEAGGALFTVSRVQSEDPGSAAEMMGQLRAASLAAIAGAEIRPEPGSGDARTSFDLSAQGRRPNGAPMQARFKWLLHGRSVYQIAAYADHLASEQIETLVTEVRIQ